jgi:hypothetical protein
MKTAWCSNERALAAPTSIMIGAPVGSSNCRSDSELRIILQ